MTTQTFNIRQIERALLSRSFIDFVTRKTEHEGGEVRSVVKVTEPPDAFGVGGGVIDFVLWEHLEELIDLLGHERLISVMKARQIGLSWLIAAYALWTAMYHKAAVVMIFSQGQAESTALLRKVHSIWDEVPGYLKEAIGLDNSTTIEFPGMSSKILAYPSTEKAGRGETATLVIQDEADFHEAIEANYTAVKPTIDAGGQLVQISTVNKKNMLSLFKETWRNSPENGFKAVFYGWNVRPSRTQEWYEKVKKEAPETAEMSSDLYMEQEYPASSEEALAPSRVMAAFDPDVLRDMLDLDSKEPIETRENGAVSIWQRVTVGRRYVASGDTAHGTGGDNATMVVMDLVTGYIVADVRGNLLSPEEFARISVNLLEEYHSPLWGIEDNDWGILTIRKAQELGYPRLYERKNAMGQDSGNAGWHTDERTRYLLYGELIEAIKSRLITIPSREGISEFMSVIRNPDKKGRIEAMAGTHDDYPIAVGICWQLRKEAGVQTTVTEIHRFGT